MIDALTLTLNNNKTDFKNIIYLSKKKSLIIKKIRLQHCNSDKFNTKQTETVFSSDVETILINSLGMVSWKNRELEFQGCNYRLAQLGNLNCPDAIIGKRDSDLLWGADGYAEVFREEDIEVLSGTILILLAKYKFHDRERLMLVKKIPVIDKDGIIVGICNYFSEVYQENIFNILLMLNELAIEVSSTLVQIIKYTFLEKKVQLSLREEECAYYLLRGLSSKEIGKILNLSYRTIEIHLMSLKEKLSCKKISSLIVKLIELGYLDNIPDRILLQQINQY